jgi:hypothetical protein
MGVEAAPFQCEAFVNLLRRYRCGSSGLELPSCFDSENTHQSAYLRLRWVRVQVHVPSCECSQHCLGEGSEAALVAGVHQAISNEVDPMLPGFSDPFLLLSYLGSIA